MQTTPSRLLELDFFRGLVLLVIVVDHIGGSILSRATLHAFALCDATEVFVFLGGFATATAYAALAERRSETVARNRFLRRAVEIYQAFLVTAALMLVVSAVLIAFSIDAPNLAVTDLDALLDAPAGALSEILLLKRQPYLASVLPMYAFFAVTAPLAIPLARRHPWLLLAGSIGVWALAPALGPWLPAADGMRWDFNPLAWQLMFNLGAIARCQPVYQRVSARPAGKLITLLALVIAVAAAAYKLFVERVPPDGSLKQNLSWLRVANFLAIAWLVANLIRLGIVKRVARGMPWIGMVGRKGLPCFVAGTAISLVADSLLYAATDGYLSVSLGLLTDAVSIGALFAVAGAAQAFSRLRLLRVNTSG